MHTICPRHPVCRPKPGKSSSGGLLTTSREFHPNCRSDRAAPIACSCVAGLWLDGSTIVIPTVIAMPGATRHLQREFSLGVVGIGVQGTLFQWVHCSPTFQLRGVPCCGGSCFRTSELMYLTNGYSVVKEHRGACGPLSSLLQLSTPQTELIFSKNLKQIFQRLLSSFEQPDQ